MILICHRPLFSAEVHARDLDGRVNIEFVEEH
jgi:hypothetical protein